MRLIDADALKEKAMYLDLGLAVVEAVTVADIDAAPTVDPVKHGHWNKSGFGWRCSDCGAHEDEAFIFHRDCGKILYSEYCRVCGTHMDEEVSG